MPVLQAKIRRVITKDLIFDIRYPKKRSMIGPTELMIILAVAAILFGTNKLPEIAREMGKAMGEFKKAQREFESEIRLDTSASKPAEPKAKSSDDPDIEDKLKDKVVGQVASKLKSKVLK